MAAEAEETPLPARPVRVGAAELLLAAVLVLALVARWWELDAQSLWLDELYSLASSTARYPDSSPFRPDTLIQPLPRFTAMDEARPAMHIWTSMREGTHPPLYILLLRGWRELGGDGDAGVRLLSVMLSLAAVMLAFDAGRALYGRWAGLWAAALMAAAWPQFYYAREARPYALLLALGVGAIAAMARIEGKGASWPRLAALGACMLGMALTHYFCIGALVALGLYAVVRLRGSARWRTLIAMGVAGALFLALWGPALWNQRHIPPVTFLKEPSPNKLELAIWRLDELPGRFLVDQDIPLPPLTGLVVMIGGLVLVRWRRELLLPALWLALTAGAIVALDLARGTCHLTWIRYTLLASPGLYLLLGGIARWRYAALHAVPGVAMVLCLAALPALYDSQKEDWRGLGRSVHERVGPGETLIFAASEPWYATDMCICLSRYEHNPGRPVAALTKPASAELMAELKKRGPTAWMVSDNIDPATVLPGCTVEREERCRVYAGQEAVWLVRRLRLP